MKKIRMLLDTQIKELGIATAYYDGNIYIGDNKILFEDYVEYIKKNPPCKIYIDISNKVIRNEKVMRNYFNCVINYGTFEGYIEYNNIEICQP